MTVKALSVHRDVVLAGVLHARFCMPKYGTAHGPLEHEMLTVFLNSVN